MELKWIFFYHELENILWKIFVANCEKNSSLFHNFSELIKVLRKFQHHFWHFYFFCFNIFYIFYVISVNHSVIFQDYQFL